MGEGEKGELRGALVELFCQALCSASASTECRPDVPPIAGVQCTMHSFGLVRHSTVSVVALCEKPPRNNSPVETLPLCTHPNQKLVAG